MLLLRRVRQGVYEHERSPPAREERACWNRVSSYEGCDKVFTQTITRSRHEKSAHEGKAYPCSYEGCDKVFTTTSDRSRHNKSVHEGQFYPCSYEGCDKIFTSTSGRPQHEKSADVVVIVRGV